MSGSMIVLSTPVGSERQLAPTRLHIPINSLRCTHSTKEVAKCQPEAFWSWMVPTDTLDRGGYTGGRCVALAWWSEIDGSPDWPSVHMPAPWPDVWFGCSSLGTHRSKVRGSTSVGTGFPRAFTRPPVRGRAGGAIGHSQGASGRSVARWRGLGNSRTT